MAAYPPNGYYQYNPYLPQQNGMTYQQQNMYQQPVQQLQQQVQQPPGYGCRPVTSREEAVAIPVDFTSPGTLMPDMAHGRIYLKRFNQSTGASDFVEFAAMPETPPAPSPNDELTALRADVTALREDVDRLQAAAKPQKKSAE